MILLCSFCRKNLGEKEPYENRNITHGMCRECYERMLKQLEGISFDEYLDEYDFPVLIVDADGRIAAANEKALSQLDKPLEKIRGFLGGEAMECKFARLPEGCGNTFHCPACTIRQLIERTRQQEKSFTSRKVTLNTDNGSISMTVSTSYHDDMVRMVIESIDQSTL